MTEIAQRATSPAVIAEMARIRRAIAPSDGGDKEDLITYAKEVVAIRDAATIDRPSPAQFGELFSNTPETDMTHFAKDRQTSIPLNERIDLLDDGERAELIHMIDYAKINRKLHEQLYQLQARGPVWDGDVISKVDRDCLLSIGACAKVCVKGEQGFNACTYFGHALLRVFDWLHGSLEAPKTA